MRCEEARDELITYLNGELDAETGRAVEEHLAKCAGCSRELELAKSVLAKTRAANDASVAAMVDALIADALRSGASDIHVDPTADGASVQIRVDGVLQRSADLTPIERDSVVARVKAMSAMSIVETKLPQDGRMRVTSADEEYDLRTSLIPTIYGEKLNIRILCRSADIPSAADIGFLPEQYEQLVRLIRQPCGALYFTGPAGSGKTTTLYAALCEVIGPGLSVVSVEDPVEIAIAGVQQVQVDRKIGLTSGAALRSFLRQDPDIIAVGEAQDRETIELISRAAMTGHMVMSTLYARHAVDGPQRLLNAGLDPFMAAEAAIGFVSTLLGRRICPKCREAYTPSAEAMRWIGLADVAGAVTLYHGAGCDYCRGTGYRGRMGLHEVLTIDHGLQRVIESGTADPNQILRLAIEREFIPMIEVARRRVIEGVTTAEEMLRIAHGITSGPV